VASVTTTKGAVTSRGRAESVTEVITDRTTPREPDRFPNPARRDECHTASRDSGAEL